MTVTVLPSALRGSVEAPPSKSMAHRLLLCAALAEGESRIEHLAQSEDVCATLDCLRALGADCAMEGTAAQVRGCDPRVCGPAELNCRESGSTLRFFLPLCLLSGAEKRLRGSGRLPARPLEPYERLCRERGLRFRREADTVCVAGPLRSGAFELPGDVSSQFVSGLLFALPLLTGDSRVTLLPPVQSRSYIELTRRALALFGVETGWEGDQTLFIPGGQRYRPRRARVEGDWSAAACFRALGLPVTGLDPDSAQGDRACEDCFARLRAGEGPIDLADCPDLGPVLFAYAALHRGGRFVNTARLRLKESDRVAAMAAELGKFGLRCQVEDNAFAVPAGLPHRPSEPLEGHGDHRVVMALTLLCLRTGGVIRGAEAVRKSDPAFFFRLRGCGAALEENGATEQEALICR